MSKCINVTAALVFYDGVQVFDATDGIGGRYVGVLVDNAPESDCRYVVVGVSPENLRTFRLGQVDLRSLMENRPEDDWFTADVEVDLDGSLTLQSHSGVIPEAYLPEPGFLLLDETPAVEVAEVRNEALARNRVTVTCELNPPESARVHSIRANKLGGLLINLQSFLKHAYAKSLGVLNSAQRKVIDRTNASLLDVVVPALDGSFRIVLAASQEPDLFGGGEITRALAVLDEIVSVSDDPEETLKRLKKYRGHVVSSYLRLLRFIAENDVSMQYAWSEPRSLDIPSHGITRKQAEPLLVALEEVKSLGIEQVTLIGLLKKIDVKGTWRLYVVDEDREYSGKRRPGVSLSNLTTERMYRFVCDEEITGLTGTGEEKKILHLTLFEDLTSKV